MKTDTAKKLLAYITTHGPQKPDTLAKYLGISTQAVHAQIRRLLASKQLVRIGKPPATHYATPNIQLNFPQLTIETAHVIEQNFSYLDPV